MQTVYMIVDFEGNYLQEDDADGFEMTPAFFDKELAEAVIDNYWSCTTHRVVEISLP